MIAAVNAVPALVALAAERTARFERGIVAFRLHRVFDVHAGPQNRHDDMEFAGVYEDGRLIKVRILHEQIGGRETDEATKARTAQQWEHPAPQDVFARPFDPKHLTEYSYDPPAGNTVRFHALVRDSSHGDGTFTVNAQGDVVAVHYTPCALPKYATSGSIDLQRAEVLPEYWTTTSELYQYRGRYFIFSGGATAKLEWSRFTRFATVAEALQSLEAGRM